jgi:hypothetical protein
VHNGLPKEAGFARPLKSANGSEVQVETRVQRKYLIRRPQTLQYIYDGNFITVVDIDVGPARRM